MFDALLKTKFYLRCKSEMKTTMRRMEIIKRKRNAVQKFLRNDVADLLTNGLYTNAYDRLFADQNLSWCYEFVEESCVLVISRLSSMSKQRECPEECMEAIPTLMFAAARFADLPELRELRSIFYERYENHLEPYVNQEFVKNLKAHIPTKEIRLQMMEEIAMEYGIEWDSKVFEQKLCKPPQVFHIIYE
ncbi:putative vacuolar protein sorting-associated protein Ist1 [Helianthus anomalus]